MPPALTITPCTRVRRQCSRHQSAIVAGRVQLHQVRLAPTQGRFCTRVPQPCSSSHLTLPPELAHETTFARRRGTSRLSALWKRYHRFSPRASARRKTFTALLVRDRDNATVCTTRYSPEEGRPWREDRMQVNRRGFIGGTAAALEQRNIARRVQRQGLCAGQRYHQDRLRGPRPAHASTRTSRSRAWTTGPSSPSTTSSSICRAGPSRRPSTSWFRASPPAGRARKMPRPGPSSCARACSSTRAMAR